MLKETIRPVSDVASVQKPFVLPPSIRAVPLKLTLLGRVLVLAVDAEDAFSACGGSLARLRDVGAAPMLTLVGAGGARRPSAVHEAARAVGLSDESVHFVDAASDELPTSDMHGFAESTARIAGRIADGDALTVFVPWHADPSADRRALNHAAFAARDQALPKFRLLEYPLATDARADGAYILKHTRSDECWMLDASAVQARKERALRACAGTAVPRAFSETEYFFEHVA